MKIDSNIIETEAAIPRQRFSHQVAWTLGAKITIAGGSMLAGVIVARWLGAASVGILASLNVMSLLAISFGGIGLSSAITYLVARDRPRMKAVMTNAVTFAFVVGAILALGIIVLTFVKPGLFGDIPIQLVTIVALSLPFQLLTLFCLAAFLGLGDIKRYNVLDLLSQSLLFVNPLVLLGLFGFGLFALVSANAATTAILSLLVLPVLFRSSKTTQAISLRFDKPLMAEMLRFGSKFYIAMASSVIILRADLLLVNYFRSSAEAGVYAVASQVGTLMMMVPGVISTVLFPRVTEAREASADMTCRVTRHAVLIMFAVCLAVILPAFLLPLLYGQAFSDVPFLVLILLPGVYFLGIETVQVQYFSSIGLPKAIPFFWVFTMAVNVVLNLIFVPLYGAYAAAVVSSISYMMMFVLVAIYFRKQTGKIFSESFLLRSEEFRGLLKLHKAAE
ncbi:MAG: oligosaccharide flippase family protein [Chloracidobacterium sp.]|nr:oligosaccharide flippase family protein [Chloracidobacterium sp.]